MTPYHIPVALRRWLAGVLAALLELGPLTPAYAALTPLGDEPLNTRNSAKPNIVLTVDDSTSMLNDFLPDYVINNYCRGGLGAMTAACGNAGAAGDFTAVGGGKYFSPGYIYQQYNFPYTQDGGGPFAPPYDIAGPGAGCYPGAPPTCSAGVNPGPSPGINVYGPGPQPSWPNSGKPYEYWLMWPAPAHSASLNAIYYDPRLTYDPPVYADGTSYDQMDAAHTSNWTKVPADPWASTITYVDLVTPPGNPSLGWINIGQWCNTDWSFGSDTDPKVCRVNGSGAAAFGSVTAAQGIDYTYPWAPPSFALSASPGLVITNTYAAQKVTLTTDPAYTNGGKLYGAGFGTGVAPAWTNAQDAKYFYENENILWCDPTSPSWPQTGPTQGQTCVNLKSQLCSAFAGACQNKVGGSCKNAPTCNGVTNGVCSGYQPPLCNGNAGVCNNYIAPSCSGGKCTGSSAQTCNGTGQSCNTSPQTCSGPFNQSCNIPGTQTCQPQVCSVTYSPAGCNLLPPDPENPCTPVTTCQPPVCTPDPGTCSITKAACTSDAQCPAQPGSCSVSGAACGTQSTGSCPNIGTCSILGNLCTSVSECAIVNGHCSKTNQVCTKSSDCPASGNCQVGGAVCLVDQDCPGTCAKPAGLACFSSAVCSATNGLCSDGTTSCTSAANCPITGGTCTVGRCQNGVTGCQQKSDCNSVPGTANCTTGIACTSSTQCPQFIGKCTGAGSKNGNQCITAANCLTAGTCSNNALKLCAGAADCGKGLCTDNTTACSTSQECPNVGKCNSNGQDCTNDNQCPPTNGVCAITNVACTTPGVDLVNCPSVGTCSVSGTTCTQNGDCASIPGPLSPSAATCSTGGVGGVATATLRADAEGAGAACRRNNKTSGAYTSGAYTYPSGKYLTPVTGGTDPSGSPAGSVACIASPHFTSVPRHYWKSEVQWCDKKIANTSTTSDQWAGFGTDVGGTCQPGKDGTHVYPRFFQFGKTSYVDNYATAAFNRVDLDISKQATASYVHTWTDTNTPPQSHTITRTFDEEMTNYANWFAYYRTRIQAVKTVTSLAFNALDDTYRVGFHTLSNGLTTDVAQSDPATFVNIGDFTAAQKLAWFTQLFAITIPLRLDTPTLNAMQRIGDYFLNGTSAELSGSSDPITISCQKNWHMLFTDGFTSQSYPATKVGDQDDSVPNYPDSAPGPNQKLIPGLTPGAPWPAPYRENSSQLLADAASDYAMQYWVTDLRTSGSNMDNNVPTSGKDPAAWQHLNFAALSLGTQGKLPTENQTGTENLLAAGTLQWPQIAPICSPPPTSCTTPNRPDNSGVDDLWHAAINGRGRFVNAQTAAELKLGMGQILQDITNQAGTRAGAGLASSSISLTNHSVYVVTFQPGWAGTMAKINVDPTSGAEDPNPVWQAATQLNQQLAVTVSDPTPWFTKRKIFTVADGAGGVPGSGVPFLWDSLSGAQQDSLAPGQPATGQAVLEYLRGNPTNEGTGVGQFRVRSLCLTGAISLTAPTGISCSPPPLAGGFEDFLGDIVDSQAVYVGPPNFPYLDGNDPGYSTFKTNNASRPAFVFAGGNDGMLHAFDDATGDEAWAFVPHDVYRPDATGLGALAYQDGALPAFRHHYYVDSTPRIYDAFFSGDWHTLLVGGLGKGGMSYYAIDVTDPTKFNDETTAAGQYLWTFPKNTTTDIGYTFGQPLIAKTRAFGGRWLVVVPSGYNNPSGKGNIFFLDAKDGTLLKTMTTGVAACANSAEETGLAHIAGYTKDFHNQLIEQIYGGDLCGNFWRFDVSCSDDALWGDGNGSCGLPANAGKAALMATFTDPGGNAQPVTTPPEIEVDVINGVDRWVFIGTGRLLASSDLTDPTINNQQQTFYAIRDGTATTPNPITAPLDPRSDPDFEALTDKVNGLSSKPVKGWFDDLPDTTAGEKRRIITPVKAALSLVAYAGTAPQDNPCLSGEPAELFVRSFDLGESLLNDAGGVRTAGIEEASGAVGLDITIFTDANSGQTAGGVDIRIAVTGANSTLMFQTTIPNPLLGAHRMSWRLLGQ